MGSSPGCQAADILGRSPRSIRRSRWRYERYGYDGLFDRRRRTPSPRRAAVAEVERVLRLYRSRYLGFNVRHFLRRARTKHGVRVCYSFVKKDRDEGNQPRSPRCVKSKFMLRVKSKHL